MRCLLAILVLSFSSLLFLSFSQIEEQSNGKKLFETNCASCHSPTKTSIGKSFPFERQKRGQEWAYKVVLNNYKLQKQNSVAREVFSHSSAMTIFEGILSKKEIDAIYDYVDSCNKTIIIRKK